MMRLRSSRTNGAACRRSALLGGLALLAAAPVLALDASLGPVNVELLLNAGVQGATYEPARGGARREDGELTWSVRLDLEWISDDGLTLGLRAEVDDGSRRSEDLTRDELYLYAAGRYGRLELGEQDGPAEVMSFHAPIVALGQVRGDFARYAGSLASLSATDTADAAKLVYLSPPLAGLRFGLSYAPEYALNERNPDPRRRIIQKDATELGVQYETPVAGDWLLGLSAAQVRGTSERATGRRDLDAHSFGVQLRREALQLGAAWVRNGDSNDALANDEREWNVGLAWRSERWGAAVSYARVDSTLLDNRLFGIGGYRDFGQYVTLRADFVQVDERRPTGRGRGNVALLELAVTL